MNPMKISLKILISIPKKARGEAKKKKAKPTVAVVMKELQHDWPRRGALGMLKSI